ncbi:hypothetical protein EcWSU1_02379 [Enterobacter ludwigii]|uniref:Uncharacterized protein n=1 Tax=Enterobacter ludwigii TaxID=299767 RepID=G8LCZ2_9ENTR|nr:hypothetical protein EcWSU1_02379 [Enterobacter ludwigii]
MPITFTFTLLPPVEEKPLKHSVFILLTKRYFGGSVYVEA